MSFALESPVLNTPRLVLRPLELGDASALQLLAGDLRVAETTLHVPHPYEDGMAERFIRRQADVYANGTMVNFAVTLRESGALIGVIGIGLMRVFNRGELGYWIGFPYWNQGYCTEAGRAVVAYGFDVLKLNRIEARHFARNPASGRVMQKLGMQREGVLRQHVQRWGRYENMVVYAILREEYRAAETGG